MLSECNQALVRASDEPELLRSVCRLLVDHGDYRFAWIGLAEEDGARSIRPVAHAGFEAGYLESADITWADTERGQSPTGAAVRTGKPNVVRDIPNDPRFEPWRAEALQRGYGASAALPLTGQGRTFGVLSVYAEAHAFDQQELRLLDELAGDLTFGIVTLRLRAERERQEQALRESLERYHRTLDQMLEGGQIIGFDWRYLYVNESAAQQGHSSRDALLGRTMMAAYPGIENTHLFAVLRRCMTERTSTHLENEFTFPDGTVGWFELSIQPIQDGIFILSVDITERKRAQAALQEREAQLRDAQRIGRMGSWQLDLVENHLAWSDEIFRIFEIDPHQFGASYESFLQAVHPEDREMIDRVYTESVRSHKPYEVAHRLLMPDGRVKFVHERCETVYDATGKPLRSHGTVQDVTERKRAEQVLRASEQRMRLATDAAELGIWEWNVETNDVKWDDQMFRIYGISPTENGLVHYADWSAAVLPEDLTQQEIILQDTVRRVGRSTREFRIRRRSDGEMRVIQAVEAVRTDENGQAQWVVGTNRDITERRRAEEELARHRERLEELVQERTAELHRIEWLLTKQPAPAGDLRQVTARPYGDLTRLNQCRLILDAVGGDVLTDIVGDYLDLLETSAAVFEKNGDYALGISLSGWCQFMDLASRNLCATTDNRVAFASGKWLCHESRCSKAAKASIETGQPVDIECEGGLSLYTVPIRAGGEVVGSINIGYGDPPREPHKQCELAAKFEVSVDELRRHAEAYETRPPHIIQLAKNRVHATARLIGEMIERWQAEARQRVLATQLHEANKELESFSYSVSHDLRAPLRHVQGYVEMMAREAEGQLSEKARRYLKTIADASGEMGHLIDDLLSFSRMSRAELHEARVDLDRLVGECVRDLELATRDRRVLWTIPPLAPVSGDPAMLKQVFANLLDNAVKYTRPRDPAQIEVGCVGEEGGRLILFVRDNGVGFDMKYAHKLFSVFQRLHHADEFEGTGIGLANVRRIVARHGGRTWAEGKPDEGATFYFTMRSAARE